MTLTRFLRIFACISLVLAALANLGELLGDGGANRGTLLIVEAVVLFAWADIRDIKNRDRERLP